MSVWNNKWSEIYDFTPDGGGSFRSGNWTSILPSTSHRSLFEVDPETSELIAYTKPLSSNQAVPQTVGLRGVDGDADQCLLCTTTTTVNSSTNEANGVLERVMDFSNLSLVRTRELVIDGQRAKQLIPKDKTFLTAAGRGSMIAMHFAGDGCVQSLQEIFAGNQAVYTSSTSAEGRRQVDLLFEGWKEKV